MEPELKLPKPAVLGTIKESPLWQFGSGSLKVEPRTDNLELGIKDSETMVTPSWIFHLN